MIPAFDRVKTVRASESVIIVIGPSKYNVINVPWSTVKSPTVFDMLKKSHPAHSPPAQRLTTLKKQFKLLNDVFRPLYILVVCVNQSERELISVNFCPKFGSSEFP
jgi:hypothetical protein